MIKVGTPCDDEGSSSEEDRVKKENMLNQVQLHERKRMDIMTYMPKGGYSEQPQEAEGPTTKGKKILPHMSRHLP